MNIKELSARADFLKKRIKEQRKLRKILKAGKDEINKSKIEIIQLLAERGITKEIYG